MLERSIHIKGSTSETDENTTNPQQVPPTPQAPHTLSTIKLHIMKKYTNGQIRVLPPKTVEILARDREKEKFKSLLSQLETHGAGVSIEYVNQKFLRSLPYSWSQVSLIMRTKPGVDTLNFDDLYNNLRVFECDVKGFTRSSSSTQNVAFVSFDNTSSTNEVNTSFGVSTSSGYNSQKEGSLSYTDDLISKGNHDSRRRDAGNIGYKARDNGKRPVNQDEHKAIVNIDEEGVDWTGHAKDDTEDYALIDFNSSHSGSDTELKVNATRLKLTTARVYITEVKYALTTSPTIYTLCIKQFWTSAKVKTINDEVRIQALVDGKRVNIKESSIRRTLRLDDAEGASYLTNIKIFEGLAKMGEVTPLFDNMLVQAPKKVGILQADAQSIPITTEPSTSKPQKKHKPKRKPTQESEVLLTESTAEQNLSSPSNNPPPSGEDSLKLKELMDLCTYLSNKVLESESEVIDIKSTYQERIKKLEGRVERLEEENRGRKIADIDDDVKINLEKAQAEAYNLDLDHQEKVLSMIDVNEEEPADVEEVLEVVKAAKLMTEVVTTAGATKVSVPRKGKESSKREGESLEQEIAKKQKMKEETEELKKHLQIVTDYDDDDVNTDATPLALNIPIVGYKIHTERNKPYFKIIRADEIIRDRFEKTKPKNYSDDYLLNTLKIVFEKPNVEASVWKDQKGIYEGLHKGYDKFQSLLSQLKTHGAGVSTEDANQKFLRYLPSSWSQVSLIMRTKPEVDTLNFDDLYNNLIVFESDVKGSTGSSSSTHNAAFVSSDNTSSTNEVNTAFGVSTSSGHNLQKEGSSSYTNDLMNHDIRRRYTGNTGYMARDNEDYALMAFNSSNSGSDTELKVNAARLKLTTTRVYAAEVKYALTASPTIYTLCIKQFWASTKVKTINDKVRIQALVDGKRVNIKESFNRHTLRLDDAEFTSCLTNIKSFEGLAKMDAKTTSWNEFSSTMASAIICLATNKKFNFSRFVQLIINHQLGDMAHHKEIFNTPSFTKKVFANMKRVCPGFSREVTSLFDNMLVQAPEEHKPKRKPTQESEVPPTESPAEQNLSSPSNDPLPSGEDSLKLKELMDLCTNLSKKVIELESEVIDIKSTYQERIKKLEGMVERLEEENRVLKELKSVHSTDDANEPVMEKEKSSKHERKIVDIDADVLSMMDINEEELADVEEVLEVVKAAKLMTEVVTTAEATKNVMIEQVKRNERLNDVVMKYQTLKRKPLTQAQARRNMIIYLKNMAGFKMDYFKGMTYDEIKTLFEKHYNFNQTFLDEINEGVKVSKTKVRQEKDVEVESSKREGESLEQEIEKKQKMEEETEELKKHLQIVTDDDDVYTDATPLALKIPIVYYKIHTERNRPYFKIIRADGNHMLFISFSIMFKNFDREDLESL
uniref:Ribonuclease H-like domain-containing protein n=1 Tax=Tanacetum cinerariifolium TaxID=118510 RepID=A0A699HK63_TANCI|nr:ribonuclease H-like domain-containing protein [Tanacetum cinerariifolium]